MVVDTNSVFLVWIFLLRSLHFHQRNNMGYPEVLNQRSWHVSAHARINVIGKSLKNLSRNEWSQHSQDRSV